MSTNPKFSLKDLIEFIFSKAFVKQIGLIFVFYLAVALILLFWLRFYTNHGQKLELPDYRNKSFEKSVLDAKKKKFQILIDDSIHVVGRKGGIIIDQNPKPGSRVKENRKIYVLVTKYSPDKIKLEELPSLYGRSFDTKKKELELIGVRSRISGYEYDKGEPNYILKVYYRGRPIITGAGNASGVQIEKGGVLDFVLSKKSGGMTDLPDLRCMAVSQAIFMIESRNLMVGAITRDGSLVDNPTGFVIKQTPEATDELPMESSIDLEISIKLPADCR
jgi:beta-lactam-binding protein with PASTA domain